MSKSHEAKSYVAQGAEGRLTLTDAGREAIESWVTDVEDNVYAFTPQADTLMVSAGMARLSRNSNDMRTILADEFVGKDKLESALLHRVVTQYGDDSVTQLYPVQMVFEGVSNIATKEIERGRIAAYLEQSTRYLRFDTKDSQGHYAYYTPTEFDAKTFADYERAMNEVFDIYSDLYKKLYAHIEKTSKDPLEERNGAWKRAVHAQACDGVRSLLPASTRATVGFVGSAQAINNMILYMMSHALPEMNDLARKALKSVRAIAPVFFERTDMPERGGLISASKAATKSASRTLAHELMGDVDSKAKTGPSADIVGVNGTEDDLVAKILIDSSDKSYEYVHKIVTNLSDEQKQQVIETYVGERYNRRAKPGRAFEMIDYIIEGRVDYGGFRDIQRSRMIDGFEWQRLGTKLGHVRPSIIDEAGLTKAYEKAFVISENAHDMLIERGYEEQAQYATLFGHVMRFNFKANARSLVHTIELRTTPQGHPAYRKFYQDIHDQISAIHPNIAKAMIFVSKDEDEALARLGAERQFEAKNAAADQ